MGDSGQPEPQSARRHWTKSASWHLAMGWQSRQGTNDSETQEMGAPHAMCNKEDGDGDILSQQSVSGQEKECQAIMPSNNAKPSTFIHDI